MLISHRLDLKPIEVQREDQIEKGLQNIYACLTATYCAVIEVPCVITTIAIGLVLKGQNGLHLQSSRHYLKYRAPKP